MLGAGTPDGQAGDPGGWGQRRLTDGLSTQNFTATYWDWLPSARPPWMSTRYQPGARSVEPNTPRRVVRCLPFPSLSVLTSGLRFLGAAAGAELPPVERAAAAVVVLPVLSTVAKFSPDFPSRVVAPR